MGGGWTQREHGGGVMRLDQVCDAALGKPPQLFFFNFLFFCFFLFYAHKLFYLPRRQLSVRG